MKGSRVEMQASGVEMLWVYLENTWSFIVVRYEFIVLRLVQPGLQEVQVVSRGRHQMDKDHGFACF